MSIYDPTKKLAESYDTHTHLNDDQLFFDAEAYIARAHEYQVNYMNLVGYDLEGNQRVLDLVKKYADQNVYAVIGWQPDSSADFDVNWLQANIQQPGVVGIGETGLDYYHPGFDKKTQIASFEKHLELAKQYDLPVTIHNRESSEDVIAILKNSNNPKVVIHSFSYGPKVAEQFLELGAYLSFSGMVTFKKSVDLQAAAKIIPLDRMLVETDAPYLTPAPFRGQRINEPMLTSYVVDGLAEILGKERDEVANATTANAKKLWLNL